MGFFGDKGGRREKGRRNPFQGHAIGVEKGRDRVKDKI